MAINKEPPNDTWSEYRRLVLAELERHESIISSIADRLSALKETTDDRLRKAIEEIRRELSDQEKKDTTSLKSDISGLDAMYRKLSNEVEVIKAKAAFFGFLAGLAIATATLIAKVFWDRG